MTDLPARPPTLALVSLCGATMRYAEVERTGARRLRRLGTCDFDLDAEAAVFGAGPPEAVAAVADALREVFAGAADPALVVVAHPTATTSFFTMLPEGMTAPAREEQLRQEAALLADVAPATPVRVRAAAVRAEATAGGVQRWFHVVHVAEGVHARLARLASALGAATYDLVDTARASAAAVRARGPGDGRADLVVGAYPSHTEVAVLRDGAFVFAHHGAGATPEDTAYFALAALDAAGLDAAAVGRVHAYGDAADAARFGVLAQLAGVEAAPLDPSGPFGRRPGGASPWELAAFAPVLGAALGDAQAAVVGGAA